MYKYARSKNTLQKQSSSFLVASQGSYFLLFVAGLLMTALTVFIPWVHTHNINALDVHISRRVQSTHALLLRNGSTVISYAGSPFSTNTLLSLFALDLWRRGQRYTGIYLASSVLLSTVLRFLLQVIVRRPRPSPPLVWVRHYKAENKSFPSGHVTATVMVGGWLLILTTGMRNVWRMLIQSGVVCMMVLIGPARIYQGKHWASDVFGGYLLGSIYLSLSLWAYHVLQQTSKAQPLDD